MKKVIVVGSVNQDISLSVSHFPQAGETLLANDVLISNGGKGANQAVALARMGADVTFVSSVHHHEVMIDDFKQDKINTNYTQYCDAPTGTAVINVDAQGQNTIVVAVGANDLIDHAKIKDILKQYDYCVLQFEIPLKEIYAIIDICYAYDVEVILNPAPYNQDFDRNYLSKISYFVPNEVEFEQAFATIDLANANIVAKDFYKQYHTKLLVTLGSQGSFYVDENHSLHTPAKKVDVVDTTAAGDTFVGAFVSGLSKGFSVEEAIDFATCASAICVGRKGAQNAIPRLEEV